MAFRIGVDVGGSFTDFAVFDEASGELTTLKVFSRPDAPGEEIALALDTLARTAGLDTARVSGFTHGTTVGINTVIQRSGDRLALFTTAGFEDVLEVARLKVPAIHDLHSRRPEPLVPRERVFGIAERTDALGAVLRAPEEADVAAAVEAAVAAGASAVVLAFLHSYRNGANEAAVKAMIAALAPGLPVFASCETWPIIREYERTTTAVIGAYVQSRVGRYLGRFETVLREKGLACPLLITKTNGGVMGIGEARRRCVEMILSGTASGVIGAGHIAKGSGFGRVLSLDIGGTSADVAVILDGEPQYGSGELVGDFHIHVPSVAVSSVGQGGGSIAHVDALGVLRVGPQSAGSTPGPACFGRGGWQPTVTDAMVACGLVGHRPLGYGAVFVDAEAARAALRPLAEALETSVESVAGGIVALSVSGMYAEVSGLVSRFGIDPREFHLFAFGGAGAMLACFLARELGLKGVVVPPRPGTVSAFGGLVADLRTDLLRTVFRDVSPSGLAGLAALRAGMEAEGRRWLREDQAFAGEAEIRLSADMRFLGQSFEIETPLEAGWLEDGDADAIAAAFRAEHARLFGHADAGAPVQLVALRLVAVGRRPKPPLAGLPPAREPARPAAIVEAWFDGAPHPTALFERSALGAGHRFDGPAIVAQEDTTTTVPPGFAVTVDAFGNLVIEEA